MGDVLPLPPRILPITDAVWSLFFDLIARGNTATMAARTVGIALRTAQKYRQTNPRIAELWAEADEAGTEALEQEAYRRAVEGVERGLFYQGERFGSEREYSDQLLVVLLKARCPEKYKDRLDVKHDIGGDLAAMVQEARLRLAATGYTLDGVATPVLDVPKLPEPIDADDPILQ